MSTIAPSPPTIARVLTCSPALYRLTVRQYDRMIDDGTIAEDDQVELIEGLLVRKSGKKRPHVQTGKKGLQRSHESLRPAGPSPKKIRWSLRIGASPSPISRRTRRRRRLL